MNNTIYWKIRSAPLIGAFRLAIVGVVITITSFGHARAQTNTGWKFIGQAGPAKVVTLDRQSKVSLDERIWTALRSICPGLFCHAQFFWDDEYAMKKDLPARELSNHAILVYSTNIGFLWNCAFRPFADNCFKK
jgi:hypothetical protein